jgi:hypothetical protein
MSELKVNKVTPRSGTTVTLGDSGDTITIPSGATITNSGTATGFGEIILGTAVASTSGTSIDFTGLPSTVKRIMVMFAGVSTSGTSNILIQLGDSGGIETTGYVSSAGSSDSTGSTTSTAGFRFRSGQASNLINGTSIITLLNGNTFTAIENITYADIASWGAGSKQLSATLDRVRITTVNGTDTFDAGSINIMYE